MKKSKECDCKYKFLDESLKALMNNTNANINNIHGLALLIDKFARHYEEMHLDTPFDDKEWRFLKEIIAQIENYRKEEQKRYEILKKENSG